MRCILCDGPLPCLTHHQFPKGKMDLVQQLRAFSEGSYQSWQQVCMMQAADEIERLRVALRDVMNASNDPYEVAKTALYKQESPPSPDLKASQRPTVSSETALPVSNERQKA